MSQPYYRIQDMLEHFFVEPLNRQLSELFQEQSQPFSTAFGSTNNHQAWPGGYLDHVGETMNLAVTLYPVLDKLRPLPFELNDALLVLFLHDLEKPWKIVTDGEGERVHALDFPDKATDVQFRLDLLKEYGIDLTEEQLNALKYVEGELDDYTNKVRVMGPLAAFCHTCDNLSARLWFDFPNENDPWSQTPSARSL